MIGKRRCKVRISYLICQALIVVLVVGFFPPSWLVFSKGNSLEVKARFASLWRSVNTAVQITPLIPYQGKLLENGIPAEGSRSMIFRLATASLGGTVQWSEGPKTVSVSNGLFYVLLGDTTALPVNIFDYELWLEVRVGGTALPRQRLMGAAYALSLSPGAEITGNLTGQGALSVYNLSSGKGIKSNSGGSGGNGAALWAENVNASNGIAMWVKNNSGDTGMVVENLGSGSLFKGFGNDGGGEEFRVDNDGSVYYEGALEGAFPRPAWNSGWVFVSPGHFALLTHNLGGTPDDYFVDLQCLTTGLLSGITLWMHGTDFDGGAFYNLLSNTSINIFRAQDDDCCDYIRARIWIRK